MAKRIQPKGKDLYWLFSEVSGRCPKCGIKLLYEELGKVNSLSEAAHIYPLNPTEKEKELLRDVELLTDDVNHRNNFILLCRNCHKKFDFPRTVEKYNELLNLKKKIITQDSYRALQNDYIIEEEIRVVIHNLINNVENLGAEDLSYKALKIKSKLSGKISAFTIKRIEREVSQYFYIIKEEFSNLNGEDFDVIASQVRAYFRKLYKIDRENYSLIINSLKEWLHVKSEKISEDACELLVYFFIQNCEVFDEISK